MRLPIVLQAVGFKSFVTEMAALKTITLIMPGYFEGVKVPPMSDSDESDLASRNRYKSRIQKYKRRVEREIARAYEQNSGLRVVELHWKLATA